ncbi:MAG: hypothetical protein JW843_09420 [Candidatus Aminicenantes bacterium]|nr:hypothetical protein [Candidatus Aminicenantes bacterium]
MNIGLVGILVIFAAFIILLAFNPRLSCFGRKIASPLYPLFRKKKMAREQALLKKQRQKQVKTEDYGFKLEDESGTSRPEASNPDAPKTEDSGLKPD